MNSTSSTLTDASDFKTSLKLRRKTNQNKNEWKKLMDRKSSNTLAISKRKSSKESLRTKSSRKTSLKSKRSTIATPLNTESDDSSSTTDQKSVKLRRKRKFQFYSWDSGEDVNDTPKKLPSINQVTPENVKVRRSPGRRRSSIKLSKAHSTLLCENDSRGSLHVSDISRITEEKTRVSLSVNKGEVTRIPIVVLDQLTPSKSSLETSIIKRNSSPIVVLDQLSNKKSTLNTSKSKRKSSSVIVFDKRSTKSTLDTSISKRKSNPLSSPNKITSTDLVKKHKTDIIVTKISRNLSQKFDQVPTDSSNNDHKSVEKRLLKSTSRIELSNVENKQKSIHSNENLIESSKDNHLSTEISQSGSVKDQSHIRKRFSRTSEKNLNKLELSNHTSESYRIKNRITSNKNEPSVSYKNNLSHEIPVESSTKKTTESTNKNITLNYSKIFDSSDDENGVNLNISSRKNSKLTQVRSNNNESNPVVKSSINNELQKTITSQYSKKIVSSDDENGVNLNISGRKNSKLTQVRSNNNESSPVVNSSINNELQKTITSQYSKKVVSSDDENGVNLNISGRKNSKLTQVRSNNNESSPVVNSSINNELQKTITSQYSKKVVSSDDENGVNLNTRSRKNSKLTQVRSNNNESNPVVNLSINNELQKIITSQYPKKIESSDEENGVNLNTRSRKNSKLTQVRSNNNESNSVVNLSINNQLQRTITSQYSKNLVSSDDENGKAIAIKSYVNTAKSPLKSSIMPSSNTNRSIRSSRENLGMDTAKFSRKSDVNTTKSFLKSTTMHSSNAHRSMTLSPESFVINTEKYANKSDVNITKSALKSSIMHSSNTNRSIRLSRENLEINTEKFARRNDSFKQPLLVELPENDITQKSLNQDVRSKSDSVRKSSSVSNISFKPYKSLLSDSDNENEENQIINRKKTKAVEKSLDNLKTSRKTSYGGFMEKLLLDDGKHSSTVHKLTEKLNSNPSISPRISSLNNSNVSFNSNRTFRTKNGDDDDDNTDNNNTDNDNKSKSKYISKTKLSTNNRNKAQTSIRAQKLISTSVRTQEEPISNIKNDRIDDENTNKTNYFSETKLSNNPRNKTQTSVRVQEESISNIENDRIDEKNTNKTKYVSETKVSTNSRDKAQMSGAQEILVSNRLENHPAKKTTQLNLLKYLEKAKKTKEKLDKQYEEKSKNWNSEHSKPVLSEPTKIKITRSMKRNIIVDELKMIDGKVYRKPSQKRLAKWIQPNLQSKISSVLNNKYEENIAKDKNEELLNFLDYVVKEMSSNRKKKTNHDVLINKLKLKLAQENIIRTTYEFFQFALDFCPQTFIKQVCPMREPKTKNLTLPYDVETVFDPIIKDRKQNT